MRRYYGDCPNCGGSLVLENDGKYYCESCGTAYAQDFDRKEVDEKKKASEPRLQEQEEDLRRKLESEKIDLQAQSTRRKVREEKNWARGSKISKGLLIGFLAFIILAIGGVMFVTRILPLFTMMNSMEIAEEAVETDLAFSIKAIGNFDTLLKEGEKMALKGGSGYEAQSADLLNAYLISPVSTDPDHNSLLLFYEVNGLFGSDAMEGSVIRVVCINNISRTDASVSDGILLGNTEVMSDTFVEDCFPTEKDANRELLLTLGKDYWIEAADPGREVAS